MSVFRTRGVRPLLAAEAVSALGSQMTYLALPWFVLVTTGSATKMGIVLAVQLLPVALLGIPSGTVVGKLGARRTMLVSDAARGPVLLAIPLLHSAGVLSFPLLLACVALLGVFIAPHFSAQRLILPDLIGEDERGVTQANAIVEGVQRSTSLLGPAAAGLLISLVGATNVLYLDAATFAFSFLVLRFFVPRGRPAPASDESRGLLAGVRFLRRDRLLAALLATALFLNAFGQMLAASLPVLAFEEFGESSRVAGAFFAAFGAGAVVGSVVAVRIVHRFDPIRLGAFSLVALTVPIWLLPLGLPAPGVMAALFLSSLFGPLVNAPLIGVITMRTPAALRPKVMTAVLTFAMLAGPLGLLVVGPLLASIGVYQVFLVIAAGQTLASTIFAVAAVRSPRPGASEAVPVPSSS
ncbi:MAG TPA: MFS transporter [Gaiellaceae bacterium]|nr:MFS transporter [Gaiellaceae bacterium]